MIEVTTRAELRATVQRARRDGLRIALVPTMGYLHEGHLSLVDHARASADFTILSLFVNPLQFAPGEDFERYPRDAARDATLARERAVDVLFAPDTAEMYERGEPRVFVEAPGLEDRLCGAYRPGHFRGVLTVVAKLLHLAQPDVAWFGRKDFQQLVLIRGMARDLDFPVAIEGAPIVREADGLAMSSRNVYLLPEERAQATLLSAALRDVRAAFAGGNTIAAELVGIARRRLAEGPLITTQYIEIVDADTLDRVEVAAAGDVLALAAFAGRTRLIDNTTLQREDG